MHLIPQPQTPPPEDGCPCVSYVPSHSAWSYVLRDYFIVCGAVDIRIRILGIYIKCVYV